MNSFSFLAAFLPSYWGRASSRYAFHRTLDKQVTPIYSLQVSKQGMVIASGGVDGVTLWSTQNFSKISSPSRGTITRGTVTSICWITATDDAFETLAYGTKSGWIGFWDEDVKTGEFGELIAKKISTHEILSVASKAQSDSYTIVAGSEDRSIHVLNLDYRACLTELYSVTLDITIPRHVSIVGRDSDNWQIRVLGLYGKMALLAGSDGKLIESFEGASVVAAAVVDEPHFVVDNSRTGFDLHSLDTGLLVRRFTAVPKDPAMVLARGVAIGENRQIIVGGSDHGTVHVFHRDNSTVLDTLHHAGPENRVYTVCCFSRDASHYIVSAGCDQTATNKICVWQYEPKEKDAKVVKRWSLVQWVVLIQLLLIGYLCCCYTSIGGNAYTYGRTISLFFARPLLRVPEQTTSSHPLPSAEEFMTFNSRMENIQAGVEEMQKMFHTSRNERRDHDIRRDDSGTPVESPDQCDDAICNVAMAAMQFTGADDLIVYR